MSNRVVCETLDAMCSICKVQRLHLFAHRGGLRLFGQERRLQLRGCRADGRLA
ncbi:MAG: hypothetical protein IH983_09495 [Planctomycetes bacterium]|nr:hypothetical protein [Planctomycetota bacterium]